MNIKYNNNAAYRISYPQKRDNISFKAGSIEVFSEFDDTYYREIKNSEETSNLTDNLIAGLKKQYDAISNYFEKVGNKLKLAVITGRSFGEVKYVAEELRDKNIPMYLPDEIIANNGAAYFEKYKSSADQGLADIRNLIENKDYNNFSVHYSYDSQRHNINPDSAKEVRSKIIDRIGKKSFIISSPTFEEPDRYSVLSVKSILNNADKWLNYISQNKDSEFHILIPRSVYDEHLLCKLSNDTKYNTLMIKADNVKKDIDDTFYVLSGKFDRKGGNLAGRCKLLDTVQRWGYSVIFPPTESADMTKSGFVCLRQDGLYNYHMNFSRGADENSLMSEIKKDLDDDKFSYHLLERAANRDSGFMRTINITPASPDFMTESKAHIKEAIEKAKANNNIVIIAGNPNYGYEKLSPLNYIDLLDDPEIPKFVRTIVDKDNIADCINYNNNYIAKFKLFDFFNLVDNPNPNNYQSIEDIFNRIKYLEYLDNVNKYLPKHPEHLETVQKLPVKIMITDDANKSSLNPFTTRLISMFNTEKDEKVVLKKPEELASEIEKYAVRYAEINSEFALGYNSPKNFPKAKSKQNKQGADVIEGAGNTLNKGAEQTTEKIVKKGSKAVDNTEVKKGVDIVQGSNPLVKKAVIIGGAVLAFGGICLYFLKRKGKKQINFVSAPQISQAPVLNNPVFNKFIAGVNSR